MSSRRWFHFHLGSALLLSLTASVLLGVNLAWRSELKPMPLSIGRGEVSQPVKAYFSPSYRGWPLRWDANDPDFKQRVAVNVGSAAGVLFLALVLSETLIRRSERKRREAGMQGMVVAGMPFVLFAGCFLVFLIGVLAWQNLVLHPDGAFAVRGWPFPYEAYVRAEAVITRETLEYWDSLQANARVYAVVDGVVATLMMLAVPLGMRWWARRSDG